jgi:hypothetical protein
LLDNYDTGLHTTLLIRVGALQNICIISVGFAGIYVRCGIPKLFLVKSHYEGGKKYCRRCEVYYYHDGVFCPCCVMALPMSPTNRRDKERLRQSQLREGEHDRIIRIIKGIKK